MLIIGLTGSIAMGKSTIAEFFQNAGVPTISADEIVHNLYAGRAVNEIEKKFPGSTRNNVVDRGQLMKILNSGSDDQKSKNFADLGEIIHPMVRDEEWQFLKATKNAGAKMAVIDIPLLFETAGEELMDIIVLASAPHHIQRERALARKDMTVEKFNTLNSKQLADKIKREKADFVIDTGCTLSETERAVKKLISQLENKPAGAFRRWVTQYGE